MSKIFWANTNYIVPWCPQISKGFFFPWLDGFFDTLIKFLSIYLIVTLKIIVSNTLSRRDGKLFILKK